MKFVSDEDDMDMFSSSSEEEEEVVTTGYIEPIKSAEEQLFIRISATQNLKEIREKMKNSGLDTDMIDSIAPLPKDFQTLDQQLQPPVIPQDQQLQPPVIPQSTFIDNDLSFHHVTDLSGSTTYDPKVHRVLFWEWYQDMKGHLAFIEMSEWGNYWSSNLNTYAEQHSQGTYVPLDVMKRFLGVPGYNTDTANFHNCYPGVDSALYGGELDPDLATEMVKDCFTASGSRCIRNKFILQQTGDLVKFVLQRVRGKNIVRRGWVDLDVPDDTGSEEEDDVKGPSYWRHFGEPSDFKRKRTEPGAFAESSSSLLISDFSFSSIDENRPPAMSEKEFKVEQGTEEALVWSDMHLTFHHLNGRDTTYNPLHHRVLFWTWFNGQEGHLAFLTKDEWYATAKFRTVGERQILVFWLNSLCRFAQDNPDGSSVPFPVMARFLGTTCSDLSECYPGIDSTVFTKPRDKEDVRATVSRMTKKFKVKIIPSPSETLVKVCLSLPMNESLFRYAWIPSGVDSIVKRVDRRASERVSRPVGRQSGRGCGRGGKRRRERTGRVSLQPTGNVGGSVEVHGGKSEAASIWLQVKELEEENENLSMVLQSVQKELSMEKSKMPAFDLDAAKAQEEKQNKRARAEKARGDALFAELNRLKRVLQLNNGGETANEVVAIEEAIESADNLKRALMNM